MGSGSSAINTPKNDVLFIDDDLQEAISVFKNEPNACTCFSDYIKTGLWMVKLRSFELSIDKPIHMTASEAQWSDWEARGYSCDDECKAISSDTTTGSGTSTYSNSSSDRSTELSPREAPRTPKNSPKLHDKLDAESYPASSSCFSVHELCAIMFAVLFPLYKKSSSYQFWLSHRHDKDFRSEDMSISISIVESDKVKKSRRLVELFRMTAAYFDSTELVSKLASAEWAKDFMTAIKSCPVPISIAQASSSSPPVQRDGSDIEFDDTGLEAYCFESFPLVFTNTAYEKRIKKGDDFTSFLAPASARDEQFLSSDDKMKAKFLSSLHGHHDVKLSIPASKKSGGTFMNMLAVRHFSSPASRSKNMVLGVHCDVCSKPSSSVPLYELQFIEDVLAIVPLLVKQP